MNDLLTIDNLACLLGMGNQVDEVSTRATNEKWWSIQPPLHKQRFYMFINLPEHVQQEIRSK